ncbi:uncharacterized protein [Aristolochia californica]|uniref:uncharacterized protein n=1 Tax=Aristolochia californica TaxID=171875 RepID=UPI0035DA889D
METEAGHSLRVRTANMRQTHGSGSQFVNPVIDSLSSGKTHVLENEVESRKVFTKERVVLGDVTNRQKRDLLSFPVDPYQRILKPKLKDNNFFCKVGEEVRKLDDRSQEANAASPNIENVSGVSPSSSYLRYERLFPPTNSGNVDGPVQSSAHLDVSQVKGKVRDLTASLDDRLHLIRRHAEDRGIAGGGGLRDSCASSVSLSGQCEVSLGSSPLTHRVSCYCHGSTTGHKAETDPLNQIAGANTCGKAYGVKSAPGHLSIADNNLQFVGSQESVVSGISCLVQETLDCSRNSGLSGSGLLSLGIQKHTGLVGDSGDCAGEVRDFNKACSCSLCLKAAYVWSELHYQDTRNRLSEVKRSMKQVRVLIGRSYTHGNTEKPTEESSKMSKKLESDLMHQWRSLFLRTEDAFVQESKQLKSDLIKLKELRENCMKDLETIENVAKGKV